MAFTAARFVCAALTVLLLVAWSVADARVTHRVHYSLLSQPARPIPTKIVLLPLDIKISEVTAGGVVEEVAEWTDLAITNIKHGIEEYGESNPNLQILEFPLLAPGESEIVEEHLALYDIVAGNAYLMTTFGGSGWRHKLDHFDYTLGNGLAFLRDRTGADTGLLVIGRHQIATAGRVAASVLAALFGGVYLPTSRNFLTTGVVDFETGDILWFNYSTGASGRDLRQVETADKEVLRLLEKFPGLEAYRKGRPKK